MEPGCTDRVPARRATTEPNDLATSRSSSVGVTLVSVIEVPSRELKGFNGQ